MLITTWTGVVASTNHIAYIALKRHPGEDPVPGPPGGAPRYKVLLCLANRDAVVAAGLLARTTAEFLRAEIGRAWAEDEPVVDVKAALRRHVEGAYFAQEGEDER